MRFILLISALLAFAFSTASSSCVYTREGSNGNGFGKTLPIQEINRQKTKPGIYSIEGFVIKINYCPPCPRGIGVGCEPCRRGNSIVVSEKNKNPDGHNLTEKEILLHTDDPKSFEQGKKYLFKVGLTDEKLHNDPELKYFKIIDYRQSN